MNRYRVLPRAGAGVACWVLLSATALGADKPPAWSGVELPPVSLPPVTLVSNSEPSVPEPMPAPPVAPAPVEPPISKPAPTPAADPAPPAPAPAASAPAPDYPPVAPPVRVYVIDGFDPLGRARLSDTAASLAASGYPDTRYGGWYRGRQFEREIRRLHAESPDTQVAIVGYSLGSYQAKAIAGRLTRAGIPVAMVGYVGSDYLRNTPAALPGGARVVNVRGDGYLLTGRNLFFNGTDLSGADNVRLPGVRHFDLPQRAETLQALVGGLDGATGRAAAPVVAAAPPTADVPVAAAPAPVPQAQASRPLFRLAGRGR